MSDNLLTEIAKWLRAVTKGGDVQGHEFHGNQYSAGNGGGSSAPAREGDPSRYQSVGRYGQQTPQTGVDGDMPGKTEGPFKGNFKPEPPVNPDARSGWQKFHEDMADYHRYAGDKATGEGKLSDSISHAAAAAGHSDAARAHQDGTPDAKSASAHAIGCF